MKAFLAIWVLAAGLGAEALDLSRKFGLGFDSIPGASAASGLDRVVNLPNAVSFRYWINEKFAWEGDLGATVNSDPSGIMPGGKSTTAAWGLGTLFKYNAARPSELFFVQWLGGVSLAQFATKDEPAPSAANTAQVATGQTTTTFNLVAGGGFEAFLPVWQNLSIEGSVRLRVSTKQTKSEGSTQAAANSSFLGFEGGGFTPLNLALHYYF